MCMSYYICYCTGNMAFDLCERTIQSYIYIYNAILVNDDIIKILDLFELISTRVLNTYYSNMTTHALNYLYNVN